MVLGAGCQGGGGSGNCCHCELVVLVVVVDAGGVKKRKERLTCWDHWVCLDGYRDWGGLVIDVGTKIGGGDCRCH